MAYVFALLALGLCAAAWFNRRDKGVMLFLLACAALNAWGLVDLVASNDEYAYKLQPQEEAPAEADPALRADHR